MVCYWKDVQYVSLSAYEHQGLSLHIQKPIWKVWTTFQVHPLFHRCYHDNWSPLSSWGAPGGVLFFFWILPWNGTTVSARFPMRGPLSKGKKPMGLFGAFCQPFQAASILPSNIFSEGLPSKLLMKSTTESFQTHFIGQMGMKWYEMVWNGMKVKDCQFYVFFWVGLLWLKMWHKNDGE